MHIYVLKTAEGIKLVKFGNLRLQIGVIYFEAHILVLNIFH